jgi:hypothetical protein
MDKSSQYRRLQGILLKKRGVWSWIDDDFDSQYKKTHQIMRSPQAEKEEEPVEELTYAHESFTKIYHYLFIRGRGSCAAISMHRCSRQAKVLTSSKAISSTQFKFFHFTPSGDCIFRLKKSENQ